MEETGQINAQLERLEVSEAAEAQVGGDQGPRLPYELIFRVLAQIAAPLIQGDVLESIETLLEKYEHEQTASKMFPCLRLVSKAVKEETDTLFHDQVNSNSGRIASTYLRRKAANPDDKSLATALHSFDLVRRAVDVSLHSISAETAAGVADVIEAAASMTSLLLDLDNLPKGGSFLLRCIHLPSSGHLLRLAIWGISIGLDFNDFSLAHLASLQELTIVGPYSLISPAFVAPPRFVPRGVKILELRRCRLHSEAVAELRLWEMEGLESLNLSGSPLGPRGARAIRLPSLKRLRVLDLQGGRITNEGVAALDLVRCPALERVVLRDNEIGSAFQLGAITSLDVGGVNYLEQISAFDLGANTTLLKLTLSGAWLTREQLAQLSRQLRDNTTLSYLDLSSCRLDDDKIADFRLSETTGLVSLRLARNSFTEHGVTTLGFEAFPAIKTVDWHHCPNIAEPVMKVLVHRYDGMFRETSKEDFEEVWPRIRTSYTEAEEESV